MFTTNCRTDGQEEKDWRQIIAVVKGMGGMNGKEGKIMR